MATYTTSWQDSLSLGANSMMVQFSAFLPRLLVAIVFFVIGLVVARIVRKVVVKMLEAVRIHKALEKTPVELFLKNAEIGQKIEVAIGGIIYWLVLFIVLYVVVSILGLTPVSEFMDRILQYIPHIFSAAIIFFFGVVGAGLVEAIVKGSLRSFGAASVRVFAKFASYLTVAIASLAAIAELGIATEFIRILFFGVVFAFSLGGGLALGLGGQDTVRKILERWYERKQD